MLIAGGVFLKVAIKSAQVAAATNKLIKAEKKASAILKRLPKKTPRVGNFYATSSLYTKSTGSSGAVAAIASETAIQSGGTAAFLFTAGTLLAKDVIGSVTENLKHYCVLQKDAYLRGQRKIQTAEAPASAVAP